MKFKAGVIFIPKREVGAPGVVVQIEMQAVGDAGQAIAEPDERGAAWSGERGVRIFNDQGCVAGFNITAALDRM
ncbi:MAG: hypothetical protein LBK99_13540 [Opitutaceae bacterium]|nr:hypothetical protein [Opitutaceae bacterium]